MTDIDLNPDGPHSPELTAAAGQIFDDCSRFLTYATMKGGLTYPADAYRLLADLYAATGRIPQMCVQLAQFLTAQEATGRLYESRGRDIADRVGMARAGLADAAYAAQRLTAVLQAVQADIAGLGVKDGTDA